MTSKKQKGMNSYKELSDSLPPFGKDTITKTLPNKEYESRRSVSHLKNVIREQKKEKELLNGHLQEAENDVKDLLDEFERCKEQQEAAIDELKEKLMFLEKRNENLKEERARKMKDYEDRLNIEKLNSKKESTLAFMNFIQTAEKDFTLFCQRLNSDFSKYKDKVKDEVMTYKLKTKANLMAKEAGDIKKTTKPKSGAASVKSGSSTLRSTNKMKKTFK